VYVGRISRDKGLADLVRAFTLSAAARPKLWLLIAGPDEDSMEKSLRALLPEALADRAVFSGFVHAPDRYLAAADFLCLPSYREGFGNVIIEAAAAGLPALGTRIYGIMDAIQDNQTGLLVSVGDVQALSAAISKWTDDPDSRKRYAHEAYKRAHDCFEQAKIVQQYRDHFITLVNSYKRI
jgi:glycosyltransferase involved in cell wall biosynthesis